MALDSSLGLMPDSSQAEVCNFEISLIIEQNIRSFDIPVQNLVVVQVFHSQEELMHHTLNLWQ